jgi:Ala-tRNA(Pro) deacylase
MLSSIAMQAAIHVPHHAEHIGRDGRYLRSVDSGSRLRDWPAACMVHRAEGKKMLEKIVRHLHDSIVPFRLASYVTPELEPKAGHPLPAGGTLVDTQAVLVNGRVVLTCFPADERVDLIALGNELGGVAVEANRDELPEGLRDLHGPIPPLGQLFGMPLILDERLVRSAIVVFRGFGDNDYFEILYDDFSRMERPRVAGFALAGELPERARGQEATAE